MKSKFAVFGAVVALLFCAVSVSAQQNELSLTVGVMKPGKSGVSNGFTTADVGSSFAIQADYSARVFTVGLASLYFDVPIAVVPKSTFNTDSVLTVRSYSSLYFTPGLKLKLLPLGKVSPYLVAGGGLARLNPSSELNNGQPSGSDASIHAAYSIGGGVDVKCAPHISLRGEIRDYNTVSPVFDLIPFETRSNNVFITGGIVLRF
jgi:opacity protein-like surface antigen